MQLAKHRRSVLIISTDPAHNISDAFSQKFSRTPTQVKGFDNLFAMEVDGAGLGDPGAPSLGTEDGKGYSKKKFRVFSLLLGVRGLSLGVPFQLSVVPLPIRFRFVLHGQKLSCRVRRRTSWHRRGHKFLADDQVRRSPDSDQRSLIASFPPSRLVQSMDFEVVLFDTAPTGHTLRLLQFPAVIEKSLGKFLTLKSQFLPIFSQVHFLGILALVFGCSDGADARTQRHVHGLGLGQAGGNTPSGEADQLGIQEPGQQRGGGRRELGMALVFEFCRIVKELTTFVCVCIAEFLSMYETERLVQELTKQVQSPGPQTQDQWAPSPRTSMCTTSLSTNCCSPLQIPMAQSAAKSAFLVTKCRRDIWNRFFGGQTGT